jgi:hypothetical protein
MRINILGCGPGWQDCPDGQGEIWGINDLHLSRKCDVILDCHHLSRAAKGKYQLGRRTADEVRACIKGAKKSGVPFYTTKEMKNVPNSIPYPLEEIKKEFQGDDYFGSGVDYAIALAIYKGAIEIHLWGILMILNFEYAHQKPSVDHWLGVAIGRGIKVNVHGRGSSILKTRDQKLYGFEIPQTFMIENQPEYVVKNGQLEKVQPNDISTG